MIGSLGQGFLTGTHDKSKQCICSVCGKHGFKVNAGKSVKHCRMIKVPSKVVRGAFTKMHRISYCKVK